MIGAEISYQSLKVEEWVEDWGSKIKDFGALMREYLKVNLSGRRTMNDRNFGRGKYVLVRRA